MSPFAARHEHQKDVLPVAEQYMRKFKDQLHRYQTPRVEIYSQADENFRKFADAKSLDALTGCSS